MATVTILGPESEIPGLRQEIQTFLTERGYASETRVGSLGAGHLVINPLGFYNHWIEVAMMVHSLLLRKGFMYTDEGSGCALYKK